MEKHLGRFIKEQDTAWFNEASGLDLFGPTHTEEFHRLLRDEGRAAALDYMGIVTANETQWVYQLGAGPAAISQGYFRLLGQYGTWPSWYLAHMIRIARAGKHGGKSGKKLAAKATLWTAGSIAAFDQAGKAIGVNLSRWSPLNSLTWSGGPMVDWLKDMTEIVGGTGEVPTAGRRTGLAKYGLKDYGGGPLTQFDPRKGRGLDIVEPEKTLLNAISMFTPGYLFGKDLIDAAGARNAQEALIEAMGMSPIVGTSWPEMDIKF